MAKAIDLIKTIRFSGDSYFFQTCLKIKAKSGKLVPFKINKAQQYIQKCIESQLARIGKVRIVLLKGRQQGGSTYAGARFYKRCTETVGAQVFILSHESKTTTKLYEMVQRFHNNCPSKLKPVVGQDSQAGMKFPRLDSSYELGTARNAETGRGFTAQFFHGSEVAFWPFAEQILAGVMQAVPNEPGTEIILESTANGVGGSFYQYVMDAKAGRGEFELIFIPWYWQDEYRMAVPPGFERTDDEIKLVESIRNHPDGEEYAFELDDEQLYWRRMKIYEVKSLNTFKQEYPCWIEEAFLFSGRPVFDMDGLLSAKQRCREPKWFEVDYRNKRLVPLSDEQVSRLERDPATGAVKFEEASGYLQIFNDVAEGKQYAIGADVAEGLEKNDYSSFDVLNDIGVQVAHYHGHPDPGQFGLILDTIGRYYNDAYLGPERNNHGHAALLRLKDLNYPNLHYQEELERSLERENGKVGWLTTAASKPFIIDNLVELIRDDSSGMQCIHNVEQCFTYVKDERGRTNALDNCFDDCVMSFAIAVEMVRRMPRHTVHKDEGPDDTNEDWRG